MSEQAKDALAAIGRAIDALPAEDQRYLLGVAVGLEAATKGQKPKEQEGEEDGS